MRCPLKMTRTLHHAPVPFGEEEDDENVVDARQAIAIAPARVVDAGQAVVAPRPIRNEGASAGASAGSGARHVRVLECSTELKTLLHTLGYDHYSALQKMGVLLGHVKVLLQRDRKPSHAQPTPKQPKASRAPAPKPAPKACSVRSWQQGYGWGQGAEQSWKWHSVPI